MTILESSLLFIQNQLLGMQWLNQLIGSFLKAIGLNTADWLGGALQFFLYDVIKIMILLFVLIYFISYIQSYFPPERTKKILGHYHGLFARILSALLGTITPFCSCSSIPLFIGFTSAGLSIGVTFSFLISSPLVDLGSLVLLTSIFGFKVAVIYVLVGLVLAVLGGTLIEKMHLDNEIEDFVRHAANVELETVVPTKAKRRHYALQQAQMTINKVYLYILIGVGIGALIHNVIPASFIQMVLGDNNPFSVLLATLIGIPMYADIFGTIPIAEALYLKGVGLGTILSFMMAVTALSLPSIIMLRKAIKPKLLIIFILIVTIGIMLIGYGFNAFQYLLV